MYVFLYIYVCINNRFEWTTLNTVSSSCVLLEPACSMHIQRSYSVSDLGAWGHRGGCGCTFLVALPRFTTLLCLSSCRQISRWRHLDKKRYGIHVLPLYNLQNIFWVNVLSGLTSCEEQDHSLYEVLIHDTRAINHCCLDREGESFWACPPSGEQQT